MKVADLIDWISKGILMAIIKKTRCYKCFAKMADKQCKKCNAQKHEEMKQMYKKQRRQRASELPPKLYQECLQTGIGKGIKPRISVDLTSR